MIDRQTRGCVYEEPTKAPARSDLLRWPSGQPSLPWRDTLGQPIPPSVCPLYLGRVAEASDVLEALPHFRRGTLRSWLGREPDPHLLELLEAFEQGRNDWRWSELNDPAFPKERA